MIKGKQIIRFVKEYPLAIISGVVIVVGSAAIFLRAGIVPELADRETDLSLRMRTIEKNVKNAKDLQEDVEAMNRLVERIQARLFEREQRAVNINFFYAMEDRMNIRITGINQLPTEDPLYTKGGVRALDLHSTVVFDIVLEGVFEDMLLFLNALHRVEPLIRVSSFQLARGNEQANVNQMLSARLRLSVLAQK